MTDLETLGIQIEAEEKKADSALGKLEESLASISSLLNGLKIDGHISKNLSAIASSAKEVASAVKGMNGAGFEKVADGAGDAAGAINAIKTATEDTRKALGDIGDAGLKNVSDSAAEVGKSISNMPFWEIKESIQNVTKDVPKDVEKTVALMESTINKAVRTKTGDGDVFSEIKDKIQDVSEASKRASGEIDKFTDKIAAIKSTPINLGDINLSAITTPIKGISSVISKELSIGFGVFKRFGDSVKGVFNSISKFWARTMRTLKFMLVRKAITAIIGDISKASKSLAAFSGELGQKFNTSISTIVSDFKWLGANILAAFSPIINAVMPIIDALISKLEAAIAVINQFFSALAGQAIFVRAKKNVQDYGSAIGGAGKQAKKLKDYLLGIDELNVLKPDDDTGSGGGGGSSGYPYEWVEQDIAKNIKNLADKIKALFKNGDFYRLGQMLAEMIADALWNIDWTRIQQAAKRIATNIADFINGFFSVDKLWKGIGHTIAQGLNTALVFADTLLRKIDWMQIGRQIGNLINQAVKEFNWRLLGQTLADAINSAFEFFYSAGVTIDFAGVGKGISDSINKFFSTIDLGLAAKTISAWSKGILDALITAVQKVKWEKVGKEIGKFFANIDWKGILKRVGTLIWSALNAAISATAGMFSEAPFTTAILGIVGITALLKTRALSNVTGFVNGVNKVLKTSMITDETTKMQLAVAKVISAFKTGFSEGGIFPGLKAGIASIREQLGSPFLTAIGTAVGAFANFSLAKSYFYDMEMGIASIGDAFTKLLVPIGLVEGALLLLFGPTSAIVGGIAALIGMFVGVRQAHEEMIDHLAQNAFDGMIQNTEDAGHTLDDFKIKMKDTADSVVAEIQQFKDGFGTLNDYIRPSIETSITTISGIVAAITETRSATEGELEELGKAFESLKDMSVNYVKQLYDNLIAMDLAQYQYIASVHGVESEEAKAIASRIGNYYVMKDEAVASVTEMVDTFESEMGEYVRIMTDANATDEDLVRANDILSESFGNLAIKAGELGVPLGDADKYAKIASDAIGELKGSLDLSDANISEAEDILSDFNDVITSNVDTYNNARGELESAQDEYIKELMQVGNSMDEATKIAGEKFNPLFEQLDTSFTENMALLQQDAIELFPKFADAMAQSEIPDAEIKSRLNEFAESLFGGKDGLTKMLSDATQNVEFPAEILNVSDVESAIDSMFNDVLLVMTTSGPQYTDALASEWESNFNSAISSAFEQGDFGGTIESQIGTGIEQLDLSSHISRMEEKVKPVGDAIDQGVGAGMEEGVGIFDATAAAVAAAIDVSLRTSTGAHSPADLTIPIGGDLDEGIAKGMEDNVSVFASSAQKISSEIESQLNSALSGASFNNASSSLASEMSISLSSAFDAVASSVKGDANKVTTSFSNEFNKGFDTVINTAKDKFSTNAMTTIFNSLPTALKQKWEESTTYWRGAVSSWFSSDVTPHFTTQKWLTVTTGIKDGIMQTWKDFTVMWKTALSSWWTSDVTPWFSSERWQPLGDSMRTGIMAGFKSIVNEFAKVMNSVIDVFNQALKNIQNGVNSTISSFNNVMTSQGMNGMPSVTAGTISHVGIPSFNAGGMPEDGLFFANSSELVGRFDNGRTAVANNEQIQSGIRESMREALIDTLGAYLSRITDNTEKIAEKDNRTFLDSRELVKELDRRRSRNGFSFAG